VEAGEVAFEPSLLRRSELLREPVSWHYSACGEVRSESLSADSLAFTLCGVPVVYRLSDAHRVHVLGADGATTVHEGSRPGAELSQSLFQRDGSISKLIVDLPEAAFQQPE
jgi:hypothetical protein